MVDLNIIPLQDLILDSNTDVPNWSFQNGSVVNSGDALFFSSGDGLEYRRELGLSDQSNDYVRLRLLLVFKPEGGGIVDFSVKLQDEDLNTFHTESVSIDSLVDTNEYDYQFDIRKKIPDVSKRIYLVISSGGVDKGEIGIKTLKSESYLFSRERIRTYFALNDFFSSVIISLTSGFKIDSFRVEGQETLGVDYFLDNLDVGGTSSAVMGFGKSNIDGSSRVLDTQQMNSFNPFNFLGVEFDTAIGYLSGQGVSTPLGKDYGDNLLLFGVDKPIIQNENGQERRGVFFADLDYTKSFEVRFTAISNNNNFDIYDNPNFYTQYVFGWDARLCQKYFRSLDRLTDTIKDEISNGFLTGCSGLQTNVITVPCDRNFAPTGNTGSFNYIIDLGTTTGTTGIDYNAYTIPDRFIVTYDGQVYDTGFVGAPRYETALLNAGVDPADINLNDNGSGQLRFEKPNSTPTTAEVVVLAPLGSTGWNIQGICPQKIANPVRLGISYKPNSQDKISIDNVVNNVRTRSIEQFIETNPPLVPGDQIELILEYELATDYVDGQMSFYLTENGGARQLIGRLDGSGSKTGSTTIILEAGKEWGVVQEGIHALTIPSRFSRVFVDGAHNEFAGILKATVISGNYAPLTSNIGTILAP